MSIISDGTPEIIGLHEIFNDSSEVKRREYSVQVQSDKSTLLFMKSRDFIERVVNPFQTVKDELARLAKGKTNFYGERSEDIKGFEV